MHLRVPGTADLIAAAKDADRIVVVPTRMTTQEGKLDIPSSELHGEELVRELLEQIELIPPETEVGFLFIRGMKCFRCMCDGDFHINLYRGDTLRVSIGYHGSHIRWRNGRWGTDVNLKKEALGRVPLWLHDHGCPQMKDWYEARDRDRNAFMLSPPKAAESVPPP